RREPLRGVIGGEARRYRALAAAALRVRDENVSHVALRWDLLFLASVIAPQGAHKLSQAYDKCPCAVLLRAAEPQLRHERVDLRDDLGRHRDRRAELAVDLRRRLRRRVDAELRAQARDGRGEVEVVD